ncbi:tail fiber assembly protein [Pseudomonas veronii]|uniref:Tail fiber assembly protein n=1 Tax=Pseudomonas veronii TaxID=76761 RepID=A0A7Y0ZWM6_PSEVE|nr:phage tail assembly chaperone [Pseudomonas veronii]NMX99360.1 tail fiber assembly protein [Pseudomonas veronii]
MIFFSAKTIGFYPAELRESYELQGVWPDDAVEVSEEEQAIYWCVCPPTGKVLGSLKGRPAFVNPPALSPEESAVIERAWRDGELKGSDDIVARHRDQVEAGGATTLTADQYKELQVYRLALRDWPESSGFPKTSKRPKIPAWLAEQASK